MSVKTKYVDLLTDISFKRVFGVDQNRDLLIAFLNEVFKGRKHIMDLVFNKNEHHGNNKEEGSAIFDLLCTGDKGERFLIEVQTGTPTNFKKRALFYTSRLISEQAPKGGMKDWAYDITEVYFLGILEESITADPRYFHDIGLCYRDTGEIFYDGFGHIFIELSKFVKTIEELNPNSDLENWLYAFKHLREMNDMPAQLQQNVIFEKLYTIAEYSNMTKEEQKIYEKELKQKWDNAAVKKQKFLEGEEYGEEKKAREIALEMKKDGVALDIIIKYTKLSIEEINAL